MASTVRMLIILGLFFGIVATSHGSESEEFETFIEGIIETWKLRSPTIVVKDDLPKICMSKNPQWLLCLSNDQDTTEIANHLASIHQQSKQDGLIFVGSQGHEKLLKHLSESAPSILTSDFTVFMPISYKNDIQLRLDSNILFYRDNDKANYELYDIFAVKAGPPIALEVGKWNFENGMTLTTSMNRWDRRTNLHGTTFINCFAYNGNWADYTKDDNGNIIGSKGYFQDMFFYFADKLNLTIETIESPWGSKLLDNGSWIGEVGFLQRQEADVVTTGLGITLQRSEFFDFPITTHFEPITLIAKIPTGVSPNMWVYVAVFGVYQWMIFLIALLVLAMGLSLIEILSEDQSGREFGTKRESHINYLLDSSASALSMVFLYTLQMGSHTDSKQLAPRFLTISACMLTLIMFIFYTGDITAGMTAGPGEFPIRTFEDVVHQDYKVVTWSPYYANFLASSEPGSAKFEVHSNRFEMKNDPKEALIAVIEDPDSKTLFMGTQNILIPANPSEKKILDRVFALKMDDSIYASTTLTLQKDSEFLQIFNHYILKALESGVFKKVYRNYHISLFIKENFSMPEPQPFGLNNVMFCLTILGVGICLSLIKFVMELMIKKISKRLHLPAKKIERRDEARMAWQKNEQRIERDREGRGSK